MGLSTRQGELSRFFKKYAAAVTGAAVLTMTSALQPTPAAAEEPSVPTVQSQINGGYQYLGDRTIRITGAINQSTATAVIDKLLELSAADPAADIELRINSGGGIVNSGMAIYDVMKSLPNDIRTVCEGEAQSMAAVLLAAGATGKRFAYPNCTIMFHQPSGGASGQVTEMDIRVSQSITLKDRTISILSEATGWAPALIEDLLERNFYPTPREAMEMGFIDNIIETGKTAAPAAPRTKLPDGFCDAPGRRHLEVCRP